MGTTHDSEMQHFVLSIPSRRIASRKTDMDRRHRHLEEPIVSPNAVLDQEVCRGS